jgi:aconitase A
MKTADLPQDTEKLSHTPEYQATATCFLHVNDKLSHNTEYPAKTIDLQQVTDKLAYKPVNPESSTDLPQVTDKWSKENVQTDKRSTKYTYKTKDRVTRAPLKLSSFLFHSHW